MPQVLWLVPRLPQDARDPAWCFVGSEISTLARRGLRLSVISQEPSRLAYEGVRFVPLELPEPRLRRILSALAYASSAVKRTGLVGFTRPGSYYSALLANRFIERFAREHQVELLHSHWAWPGGTGGSIAARAANAALVVTLRGMEYLVEDTVSYGHRRLPGFEAVLRRTLRLADAVTVASTTGREELSTFARSELDVRLIPNGVNTSVFSPHQPDLGIRRRLGCSERTALILGVGVLTPRKGFDLGVRALSALVARGHDAMFAVVGTGPQKRHLEELAERENVRDRVRLVGPVSPHEMPTWYAASDLYWFLSTAEGFGNVVIEALACGKPVVGFAVGAGRDAIADGENGFRVPPGDLKGLIVATGRALLDTDLRRRMGCAARRTVERSYTIELRAHRFAELYDEILAARRRSRTPKSST